MTFLIAGHETTSGLLSFAIYMLLQEPAGRWRGDRRGVDRVLGVDHSQPIKFEQLAQLGYVEQVLKETLRLWPTAPAFGRTPKEDTVLVQRHRRAQGRRPARAHADAASRSGGLDGSGSVRSPSASHRTAPSRFRRTRGSRSAPAQRACIGRAFAMQEAMLVLASLLWKFELTGPHGYELRVKESLTLKPDGLTVRAKRRASTTSTLRRVAAAPKAEQVTRAQHGTPLLVLYGSNSGSAKDFGERVARDATARGYAAKVAHARRARERPAARRRGRDRHRLVQRPAARQRARASCSGSTASRPARSQVFATRCSASVIATGRRRIKRCLAASRPPSRTRVRRALHARGEADAGGDFFGAFETWSEAALAERRSRVRDRVGARRRCRALRDRARRRAGGDDRGRLRRGRDADRRESRARARRSEPRSKRHIEIALPAGRHVSSRRLPRGAAAQRRRARRARGGAARPQAR